MLVSYILYSMYLILRFVSFHNQIQVINNRTLSSVSFHSRVAVQQILCTNTHGTVQFKLDRTHMQQGHNTTRHDTTHFSFHTCASLCVHARLVMSNLLCKALVYALDMCMMHACMSGMYTLNLDYACMQIVRQGQRNKLYKHVYVLRCNSSHDTRRKSC